jgi:hypothetical protein
MFVDCALLGETSTLAESRQARTNENALDLAMIHPRSLKRAAP